MLAKQDPNMSSCLLIEIGMSDSISEAELASMRQNDENKETIDESMMTSVNHVESLNEQTGLLSRQSINGWKPNKKYCSTTTTIGILSASSSSHSISSIDKKSKKGDVWFSIYLMLYVSYLMLGSMAFKCIESDMEVELKSNFRDARLRFLQKYSNIIDHDLEVFIEEVLKLNGHGISAMRNASSESNWSFGNALFFSSTVITTIGYGHVTPLTESGKWFCILYAILGIPLTLVLLSAAVTRLMVPSAWLLDQMRYYLGDLYQPLSIRVFHLILIVITCGIIFLVIPSVVFAHLEPGWSKLDAFYYCFISLTTVGLGDFIPGDQLDQSNRFAYKIAVTVYLFLGLIAVMLSLSVFYDIPQLNLSQLFSESDGCEPNIWHTSTNAASNGVQVNPSNCNSGQRETSEEEMLNIPTYNKTMVF